MAEDVVSAPSDLGAIPSGDFRSEGVQQVPAPGALGAAVAAETRDLLLKAISAEARHLSETLTGQGASALEKLAHAYALVTSGDRLTPPLAGRSFQASGSPIGDDYVVTDPPRPTIH